MKKRLPQIHIAGRRHLPAIQSPILKAVPVLLIVALMCVPVAATDKAQNPQDPYATAENYDKAPAVNAADLAYRTILFEDFTVPAEWEEKARPVVTATEDQAISRLSSTHAFATIAKKQNPLPGDPFFVVKCTLLNYRIVSTRTRILYGSVFGQVLHYIPGASLRRQERRSIVSTGDFDREQCLRCRIYVQ